MLGIERTAIGRAAAARRARSGPTVLDADAISVMSKWNRGA